VRWRKSSEETTFERLEWKSIVRNGTTISVLVLELATDQDPRASSEATWRTQEPKIQD
jgi:hypothetical protein